MKKRTLLAALVAGALSFASQSAAAGSYPLRILPLGDSITYGSHGQDTAGYRGPLYFLLKDAGYEIDYVGTDGGTQGTTIRLPDSDHEHEGHSGWCTANEPTVARMGVYDNLPNCFARILAPNVVLLHIGTNDAEDAPTMTNIVARYRKILDRITTLQPSAHVIVTTPLRRAQQRQEALLATHLVPYVKPLAEEYAARGRRVHFLDMRSRISLDDLDDGLHPTCAGYAKMAQAWFEAIRAIFPTPGSHDDPQPTVVRPEWDDLKPETFAWRFNEAMCPEDAEDLVNYTIAGRPSDGAKIVSASLSKDRRTVTLRLAGLVFGRSYRLTVRNLRNSAKTRRFRHRVDEIRPVDPKSLRRGGEANVPDARRYRLVYSIDLPRDNADYCRNMPVYDVDRSDQVKSFSRVAYYLELRRSGEPLRYVWASFDALTNDVKAIGIPAGPTGVTFQCPVRNLRYESNDSSVGKGVAAEGYIEFFKCAYNERNTQNVKGARNDRFDWGDNITDPDGNFGSMQVHDVDRGLTLFAYNRWRGGDQDLGIGNRPDYGHTDWTYSFNSPQYDIRRLQVYVCP